ncbi:TasA family protein [Blastococcus brunescens]|uniref:TasA family protein n=1 Tax=Blastococcus brunescens TaxID=1564165 RepID=A0ABZ1B2T5_9ACTN|nr:TasA family protein [Blastococcus sp. BMG 8361]WRL65124.1 TasA family protein [Blastococcus sp. BMG 8361]
MSIRTDGSSARRSTITKAVASVGVLAAAGAVAGLGTFGSFTDSTTPVNADVAAGTVSINLSPAANYRTVQMTPGGLLPGDSTATPFDVRNDGDVAWESLTFSSWATRSSVLDSDPVHGLQLTLESCSTAWTVAGSDYACGGEVTPFYTGPIVTQAVLTGTATHAPGGVEHLLATIAFPDTAGQTHTDKISDLAFRFTAVQRAGAAG